MAITRRHSTQSKRMIIQSMHIVFLGWLILLSWALALWGLLGFEKAYLYLEALAKQQTAAVNQFNDASMLKHLKSWWSKLPTPKLHQTPIFINHPLNTIFPQVDSEFSTLSTKFAMAINQLWILTKLTTTILGIKLMILVVSLPLFGLAITAGLVDGLNQRAIRTASLGRESTYVFHQISRHSKKLLLLLITLWLVLPVSISPALLFVPLSLLLGMLISIVSSRFKKYW
jgi:integrating conjugative element membrane protein (TIGR03747 family)